MFSNPNGDCYGKNSSYNHIENLYNNDQYLERNNDLFSYEKTFYPLESGYEPFSNQKANSNFSYETNLIDRNKDKFETDTNEIDYKYHEMLYKSITINRNLNLFYNKNRNEENNSNVNDFLKKNNILDYFDQFKQNKSK